MQLQCWTKTLGKNFISVVEPQTVKERSILGFSFGNHSLPVASDIFDMSTWYTQWPKKGPPLAPLTTRADFISEITNFHKDVILVEVNYKWTKKWECEFKWKIEHLMKELAEYPLLKVVRKVCVYVSNGIPAKDFRKLVFGDLQINNTVVVFSRWRGVGDVRVKMKGTPCIVAPRPYGSLRPSAGVVRDVELFANRHLGGFNSYVSVSARFEKLPPEYWTLSQKQRRKKIAEAIDKAMPMIESLKNESGVNGTYLAYDYGKFGSRTFEQNSYYHSKDLLEKFQEDIYDGKLPYSEYKKLWGTFKFQNPGYIAMAQMTLSSRAKCLYIIGWGHCIEFVTSLFKAFHRGQKLCVSCYSKRLCSQIKH